MNGRFERHTVSAARTLRVSVLLGGAALMLGAAWGVCAAAQSPSSVLDGVYTADQAARGQKLYTESCALCHGAPPTGTSMAPGLSGDDFLATYNGMTAADLFTKTIKTMPGDNPGTLTPRQTADLLAYVFSANKWPAGGNELPSDLAVLKQIRIRTKASR
jgi:mono/diheme cytochrome c family protein